MLISCFIFSGIGYSQLALDWQSTDPMNCDADGYITISNSGQFVEISAMEGRTCEPCTTNGVGGCAVSSGLCSTQAEYLGASIDVSSYNQVSINFKMTAESSTLNCSSCNDSDEAYVEFISTTKGLIYTESMCGYESQKSFSTIFTVDCDETIHLFLRSKSDQVDESYSFETSIIGIGSAAPFTYSEVVSFDYSSTCEGEELTATLVVTDCEDCEIELVTYEPYVIYPTYEELEQLTVNTYSKTIKFVPPQFGLYPIQFNISNADRCYTVFSDYYEVIEYPEFEIIGDTSTYINDDSFKLVISGAYFSIYTVTDLSSMNQIEFTALNDIVDFHPSDIAGFGDQIGLVRLRFETDYYDSGFCEVTEYINIMVKECKTNDYLTQTFNSSDNFHFEAEQSIESNSQLLAGATITFDAGQSINLNQGFEVSSGASFDAFIGGCDN